MLKNTTTVIIAAIFCLSFGTASRGNKLSCQEARTTVEMTSCLDREFHKIDADLNDVYQRIIKDISPSGEKYRGKTVEEALREAQRSWIRYRDAECKDLVSVMMTGGSATTIEVMSCMIDKTRTRIRELDHRFLVAR